MSTIELPAWAQVSERRRGHIERVTALIDLWAAQLHLVPADASAWHDAACWHDALRDASEETLRDITGDFEHDVNLLHGPAAARYLADRGETRHSVIEAVRWHTVGSAAWDRTGRALYMADYLEPGRNFAREDRAFLAAHVPLDFDGVFRQVVRERLEWTLREGKGIFPQTAELWNHVR